MRSYRPVSCTGRDGAPCSGCLRFTNRANPFEPLSMPEIVDGRCDDYRSGRGPVAPRATLDAAKAGAA